ncbi:MAG: hypothetical protein FJ290_20075 [Planctomycetes bacterium]|nr:hypothetical protein [Planctomycetota bacterium]
MKKLFGLLVCCFLAPSCAHVTYRNTTTKPISFTSNLGVARKYEVVAHVERDFRRKWLFWYLQPIGRDGSDMIAEAVGNADGMANLKITAVFDFWDVLFSNLTQGIYCSRLVSVRGDQVRFTQGP